MLFKEINRQEFDELAPEIFPILASNMKIIHPEETLSYDDFSIWLKYNREHFFEKVFIIILPEEKNTPIGYFQYSVADDSLLVEEIEIMPEYQVFFGVLRGLFRFMQNRIPDSTTKICAYINKNNPVSGRLAKKLGLSVIDENASGTSFLYSGEIQPILERYTR